MRNVDPIYIKNNQFETSRAHNTDRVHNCRVKVVFIENDVKYYQLCLWIRTNTNKFIISYLTIQIQTIKP